MNTLAPLMNRSEAEQVLSACGVSALILSDPVNIYHATGFWPQMVTMGQSGTVFAVVPAAIGEPVVLITSQFIHYLHDVDDVPREDPVRILLYTAPDGLEGAAPPIFLNEAFGGRPDPMDAVSRTSTLRVLSRRPAYPTAASALKAAAAPFAGSIAVDTLNAAAALDLDGQLRPAEPLLRQIRMIKSSAEIALMRRAASSNADAAKEAILSMRAGKSYEDLRLAFFEATGRRGGIPLFMSTDSMAMRRRDGILHEGRSFQIDAVSSYAGYYGDFGRTVFVGEPDPMIIRMVEAATCANDAISRALRPGLRYSDVRHIGHEAVKQAGYDVAIACGTHSVGLYHTDEAFQAGSLNFAKDDHVIRKDMVVSVDCPVLHLDAGGNVHLEDLWLITEDGCEPLNERGEAFFQI
ncbi:Xaa-Pro peptidase family protein [Novosphingobium sp. P6W]|uniref:M24 family metallopeptidase n=1 Tax=Novosphingobium sp. P6W TaxID=1609758 RepID=UPI0005C2C3CE|nr:M24 family metallopeptidase [Novosphingobium sp. P6W]AXB79576.1 aminopeptidase P family protein [Novosphingobium sp. P6W]KIS34318.1 hypothetical protein TQ38_01450 [Novosphingobium sp. P6W]